MSGMIGESRQQSTHKSVEWYTPKWVFDELGMTFDLDPCSPHDHESFVPAARTFTVFDNGLSQNWAGTVWLNPPYGRQIQYWMERFVAHGNGIALVFSRTDSRWCQQAMRAASAILFFAGRIEFVPGHENKHKGENCGAGTMMLAFGDECADAVARLKHRGIFFDMRDSSNHGCA